MATAINTAEWARFWRVTQRTAQNWIAAHAAGEMAKIDDVAGILAWALTARNLKPPFIARCAELRTGVGTGDAPKNGESPKEEREKTALDWQAFKAKLDAKGPRDHQTQITNLGAFLEFYEAKLEEANETNNQQNVKFYNELVLDTSNTIRQQKLAADKLGLEEGALFTKAQVEKIVRALAFWSMRGVDMELAELCPKLPGKASVVEVRALLEPWLLSVRFVRPFARAARVDSDSAMSPFIVATIKDTVDDYIENGAKEFERS